MLFYQVKYFSSVLIFCNFSVRLNQFIMKRIFLLFIFISSVFSVINAQNVGINSTGATPNASAGLDVDFTNKGVLIPRVSLSATNSNAPIGAGVATSLLIYNTATAGTSPNNVTPGYYYWDGTKWVALAGDGGKNWSLTGNAGTIAGTNFLGTTDNIHLIFKTNNTERLRILNNGNIGIAQTNPTEKLDVVGNIKFSNALMPNNLAGTTGQVLVSQGSGVAPVWQSPASILKTYSSFSTRTRIPLSGNSTTWTDVSGLTKTITTSGPATFIIMTYGSIEIISSVGNAGCEFKIQQNGIDVPNAFQTIDIADANGLTETIGLWSFQTVVTVAAAGTYTFKVQAHKYYSGFDNFYAGGNTTAPVSSQNQGALIIQEFDQ